MNTFIHEHPYLFFALCVIVLIVLDNAWANLMRRRK